MDQWKLPLEALALLAAHLLSWVAVIHALLTKKDPRSALGWVVTALLLPGLGALLYGAFGIRRSDSRAARLMHEASLDVFPQRLVLHGGPKPHIPPGNVHDTVIKAHYHHLTRIGRTLTGRNLCGGNAITPLFNGDEAYPAMCNAIRDAKRHVFLATYIFNGGTTGAAFCDALRDAAQRGVDVRVLVDGVGCLYSWSKPWRALAAHGVRTAMFLPPRLFPPLLSINLRNHRKVLVCDNVGFTGGMNIADYHTSTSRDYAAKDVQYLCSGPIVAQLQETFLLDWSFSTHQLATPPALSDDMCGDSLCRMVLDGPGSDADPLHDLICSVTAAARRSISIMTPYFLPTHELMGSLRTAALRGVDVHIILPARNNLCYVHWATQHLLPSLLRAGVRVFYQPPPFAHTKLLLIDDFYTQFGSANLDPRSMRLNFEGNMEVIDTTLSREMHDFFDETRRASTEVHLEDLQAQALPVRLRNAACWIFSPYL